MNFSRINALISTLLAAWALFPMDEAVAQPIDPGNLRITVRRNPDASVTFSASGTARALRSGSFSHTTTSDWFGPAPNYVGSRDFPLPPGITLTVLRSASSPQPEAIVLPVTAVVFNRGHDWSLGRFEETNLEPGDTITGNGSVTVNHFHIFRFVPGETLINDQFHIPTAYPVRISLYQVTYEVIPYRAPILRVSGDGLFPPTKVGRGAKQSKRLGLRNYGDAPPRGFSSHIRGASSDFRMQVHDTNYLGEYSLYSLRPITVRFRPTRRGPRRATLVIRTKNALPISVPLRGRGVGANSPRFVLPPEL